MPSVTYYIYELPASFPAWIGLHMSKQFLYSHRWHIELGIYGITLTRNTPPYYAIHCYDINVLHIDAINNTLTQRIKVHGRYPMIGLQNFEYIYRIVFATTSIHS